MMDFDVSVRVSSVHLVMTSARTTKSPLSSSYPFKWSPIEAALKEEKSKIYATPDSIMVDMVRSEDGIYMPRMFADGIAEAVYNFEPRDDSPNFMSILNE